jgi:ABC-type branched-subunit amino acid transport system ATPase component/branched-subunit amino acid ABC-type transport system permease component
LPVLIGVGIAAGVIVGIVVGAPSLRIGGFYLANTTLLFALAVPAIATNTAALGGAYGFSIVGNPQYPSGTWLYELILLCLMLFLVLQAAVRYSRVGRRLLCIGSSVQLGASLGINPYRTKLMALAISSIPAGAAGAIYLYSQQLITPDSVTPNLSFFVLAAIVLGGFGTLLGPIVGTIIVVGISVFFAQQGTLTDIGFGLLLIVLALGAPGGLAQLGKKTLRLILRLVDRVTGRKPTMAVAGAPSDGAQPDGAPSEPLTADAHFQDSEARAGSDAVTPGEARARISAVAGITSAEISQRRSGARSDRSADSVEQASQGIEVIDVSRSFGGIKAVSNASLTLRPHEVHALVGSNGSGKTTVLNLVSGFYRIDSGKILVDGVDTKGMKADAIARKAGIARTFQTPKFLETATLEENLQLGVDTSISVRDIEAILRLPRGRKSEDESREVARYVIDTIGLRRYSGTPVSGLPHGLRRIAEVGRCLTVGPRYLLLDEPGAGLSRHEMDFLREIILGVAASGVGILVVEHNLTFVRDVAHSVTVMDLGQVVVQGEMGEVLASQDTRSVFLGSRSYQNQSSEQA